MKTTALIVAGGSGIRFNNNTPKQFLLIDNKPVLMYTIERFCQLDNIYVVIPKFHFDHWHHLCESNNFNIKHTLVEGGKNRFDSVKNGLRKITNTDIVLIHDGVRPCVSKQLINNLINNVEQGLGVIPTLPLTESIRLVENNKSQNVLRKNYMSVQTPQCFKYAEINKAYSQDYCDSYTDDASVFEAFGNKIITVDGENQNIKITFPTDLKIASDFLRLQ